jgi:rod shape-determining protein MreD
VWRKNALVLAFGLGLLVVQSSLAVLVPTHPVSPMLLVPVVLHLGVSPDVSVTRGAFTSFALGWMMDEFCGAPMGLSTFVLVAAYLVTHGAVNQLVLRAVPSQVLLTFAVSLLGGGTMLALRAIFGPGEAFPLAMPVSGLLGVFFSAGSRAGAAVQIALELVAAAAITAAIAPAIFSVMVRIDATGLRARQGGQGAPA